jgi:small subunit ribosomal protein S8
MGSVNDPIANLLTVLRNAKEAEHRYVDVSWSKMKEEIVKILKDKGFVSQVLVKEERKKKTMRIFLKYGKGRKPLFQVMKRVSKPSLRQYVSYQNIPYVMGGTGLAILSTSKGVKEGKVAREEKIGGELLCLVW